MLSHSAMLLREKLGPLNFTAEQAKREAESVLADNRLINDAEYAYSPSTGAVGMRWDVEQSFRVFNVRYPMAGESESVSDWVSVGKGLSDVERTKRHARHCAQCKRAIEQAIGNLCPVGRNA